jgi:multidrug efflux pump
MQILFGGLDLSKVKIDGKEYDVIAQLERESRLTAHDLESAYVRSRTGQLVQLASVVHTEAHAAPGQINHYNRLRSAEIQATPSGFRSARCPAHRTIAPCRSTARLSL